ncbi:GLPGLI family protein [Mucilaginibacter sp. UR6-1]|uniref:GLPGLI family protein n=1 Tax=Mucilaginibacter sp. UR6-1 TaxID=1435643 RepID=UPI001E4A063D|nr:GLPGLI family protein [Mucilaginibacter sp. UR6-1]MCC8408535.1 GLPGLI family protein [Mucilaginibacter sp. UR6-1]
MKKAILNVKIIFTFSFFILSMKLQAQNISARYTITKNVSITTGDKKKEVSLNLTGNYYRKGNRYIFWEQADYLSKYQQGTISVNIDNDYYIYNLNTDTIQALYYHDYDSLIVRYGLNTNVKQPNGLKQPMRENPFEKNYSLPWVISQETKIIKGFKCQKATDRDQWVVWFCPDIPADVSLHRLRGLPGLVVEAYSLPTNETFLLTDYKLTANIDDKVFARNELKGPFKKGALLKSLKTTPEKTKAEKQQELLNQN